MRSYSAAILILTTAALSSCGGASAESDSRVPGSTSQSGSPNSASASETDMSAVVIEMGGERWTGWTCPQKVVRVFNNPMTGSVPMVPAMCTMPGRLRASIELMVQGSSMNFESGSWSGDDVRRRIAVEFEADGYDLDTKRDVIEQASRLTISTWDAEGLIEGELDLIITGADGSATIQGPFTIVFEVQ